MTSFLREPAAGIDPDRIVVFQGHAGAYAHLACRQIFPTMTALPSPSFRHTLKAISNGEGKYAVIPIENTLAGRVADLHELIPVADLYITREHFQPVDHKLMSVPGAKAENLKRVRSHVHALSQCRGIIEELDMDPIIHYDTAGAAKTVAENEDPTDAVIGSELAAEIYGLEILRHSVQDGAGNTTRFVVFGREPAGHGPGDGPAVTSFIMNLVHQPASLFKALGAFATNGIDVTKLESYLVGNQFDYAQFFTEFLGHPEEPHVARALRELDFHTNWIRIMGVYRADEFRFRQ